MRYFLCNKCGNSILFVPDEEGAGGMCMESAPYRSSGICGGGFTIELIKKADPVSRNYTHVVSADPLWATDRIGKLLKKRTRFLVTAGKVRLTKAMCQKKAAQLRRLDEEILFLK